MCGSTASCSSDGLALNSNRGSVCKRSLVTSLSNGSIGLLYVTVEFSKGDQDDWCNRIGYSLWIIVNSIRRPQSNTAACR